MHLPWYLLALALISATSLQLPDLPTTPVLRIDLSHLTPTEQAISIRRHIDQGTPVVFQNSSVAGWPAVNKWLSEQYVSAAFNHEPLQVKVSKQPVFTLYALDAKRRQEDILQGGAEELNRKYKYEPMTVQELFHDDKPAKNFCYYSGEMPDIMQHDVHLEDLVVNTVNSKMSRGILWMGNQGVTAQTHFDRSYNMFAQIVGQKSFYLYPPGHWRDLHLYPSFFGSRRQCRYQFPLTISGHSEETCNTTTTTSSNENTRTPPISMLATLEPGELLYIPPFYFHTVVSLSTPTISYSVLSPSAEEFYYSEALYARVPFNRVGASGSRNLLLGVKLYIDQILSSLHRHHQHVIRTLYASRHEHLPGTVLRPEDQIVVPSPDGSNPWCTFRSKIEQFKLEKKLGKKQLKEAVNNVTRVFDGSKIQNVGAVEILLHDLIEELLVFATADGGGGEGGEGKDGRRRVARVLRGCWLFDKL